MTYATELPYAPPATRRSAIPKVIGILMIIFSSLALLSGLIGLASSSIDDMQALSGGELDAAMVAGFAEIERIGKIMSLVGLPISGLHLAAGIASVRYRASAPKLAIVYAIVAAVHTIGSLVVSLLVVMPAMESMMRSIAGESGFEGVSGIMGSAMSAGLIVGTIAGLAWPTVVGVLMSRPSARDACVR